MGAWLCGCAPFCVQGHTEEFAVDAACARCAGFSAVAAYIPRGLSVSDQGEETVQYHAVRGRSARSFFAQARIWKFAVGAACGPR